MKFLRIVAYIVAGALVLWALLGLFARKNYHIERSIDISAPHAVVHEQVRYFKNFPKWSPWHNYDPTMKTTVEGTDGAPGAIYRWQGNDKVGTGWQEIKSVTPERVSMDVHFQEPWESTAPSYLALEQRGDSATHVTWAFDMHVAFPWNAFAMLTDVNAFVGKDYERGLENLKRISEEIARKRYNGFAVKQLTLPVRYYAGVRQTVPMAGITKYFATHLPKITAALGQANTPPAGPPSGLFWMWDESLQVTEMAAPIPVETERAFPGLSVFPLGGNAYSVDFQGPYEQAAAAHEALDQFMAERQLEIGTPVVEEYLTGPATEPDSTKWVTRVIYFAEPEQ